MKCGRIMYPAEFWILRPLFRPEISVGAKFCSFLALCDLAPPLFSPKMIKFKTFVFFYLRYVNGYYNQALVLWCCSSQLLKIYKWWPRWCQKNVFFNKIFFTADFSHFIVTNVFEKICDKKVNKVYSKKNILWKNAFFWHQRGHHL